MLQSHGGRHWPVSWSGIRGELHSRDCPGDVTIIVNLKYTQYISDVMIALEIITSAVNNSMQTMVCPWTVDKKSWYASGNARFDSGFLELYSGFPTSDSRFHKKNYGIPDSTSKNFPDPESGLFYRRRSVLKITLIVLMYVSRLEFFNTKEL